MTVLESPPQPTAGQRRLPPLRAVLFGLLVLTWVAQLTTSGREVRATELVEALQSGRTSTVLVLSDRIVWRDGHLLNNQLSLPAKPFDLSSLRRQATDGEVQLATADDLRRLLDRYVDPADVDVRVAPGLADPTRAQNLLFFVVFLVLVFGRQPLRFTRWGWAWLLLIPGGLGDAAFLLLSQRPTAQPRRLRSGGEGFFLTFGICVLLGMTVVFVRGLVPVPADLQRSVVTELGDAGRSISSRG